MSTEVLQLIARSSLHMSAGFPVTVTGVTITCDGTFTPQDGFYSLCDDTLKPTGFFKVAQGKFGEAHFRPPTTEELQALMCRPRMTDGERLDRLLGQLESAVDVLDGRAPTAFTRPNSEFFGQTPERVRSRLDHELTKLEKRGIVPILACLRELSQDTHDHYGLMDASYIDRLIGRIQYLFAWRNVHPATTSASPQSIDGEEHGRQSPDAPG